MKTLHIADLHYNPQRDAKVISILDQLITIAKEKEVSLITNSGENFHNPFHFNGIERILDKWGEVCRVAPVVTIDGTQGQHERPGMLAVLARCGVTVLSAGTIYYLYEDRVADAHEGSKPLLQIAPMPHAHKGNILAKNPGMSRDEANAFVNKKVSDLFLRYGATIAQHPESPSLCIGHGVVSGVKTRDIPAISQSAIYSTEADLQAAGCDFYLWGHYHIPTEFSLVKGGYLGSFAWDFGETDYKPAVTVIDWDTKTMERIPLDIPIKKVFSMNPGEDLPDMQGCDARIINNETEWTVADGLEKGANSVQIITEVKASTKKIRSQEVMEAVSYQDKFLAVYPEATEKQLSVCEAFWNQDISLGIIPKVTRITPLWVEIHGSKAFSERSGMDTVRLDFQNIQDGINMLVGPGGHGKSTLIDYLSPHSVLSLQSNPLISTFELHDSYIKQAFLVNGERIEIDKFFKVGIKNPTSEYYAYTVDGDIRTQVPGLTGNKTQFNDWCLKIFGSVRKYATSVIHTQFADNTARFQGQTINPSILQGSNQELKELFHELAGTDMKHLETRCKEKAGIAAIALEEEEKKRGWLLGETADPEELEREKNKIKEEERGKLQEIEAKKGKQATIEAEIKKIEGVEAKAQEVKAVISSIDENIKTEGERISSDENELKGLSTENIQALSTQLQKLEADKLALESAISAIPGIKEFNQGLRTEYEKEQDEYNRARESFNNLQNEIKNQMQRRAETTRRVEIAELSKKEKHEAKKAAHEKECALMSREFTLKKTAGEDNLQSLKGRIQTGQEFINKIKPCENCGHISKDDEALKIKYQAGREQLILNERLAEKELLAMGTGPALPAYEPPNTTAEDKEITLAKEFLDQALPELPKEPLAPSIPAYRSEDLPAFDHASYHKIKEQVEGFDKDLEGTIRGRIRDTLARIETLKVKKAENEGTLSAMDTTNERLKFGGELRDIKEEIARQEQGLASLRESLRVLEYKLQEIEEKSKKVKAHDEKILVLRKDAEFWLDMQEKWGQKGIPARILEHTGPYVDNFANQILERFYPIYKVNSETTRMDSTGKKELEIFSINVINQETGRTKPLNAISGEERNFISIALRYAFRKVNEENSLVTWTVAFEDEPDAHVSANHVVGFWDMIEEVHQNKKTICIAHSEEVKSRFGATIDIGSIKADL